MPQIDPLQSFLPWLPMSAAQRLLLLIAAGRTTGYHLIAGIQSTETVASPRAAFRSAAAPRYQSVLGMLKVRYLGLRIGAVDPEQT